MPTEQPPQKLLLTYDIRNLFLSYIKIFPKANLHVMSCSHGTPYSKRYLITVSGKIVFTSIPHFLLQT